MTLFQLTAASGAPVEVGSTQPLSGEVISWSADGAHIVSGDGTLAAVGTAAVDHLPNADGSWVDSASFSPDGKRLAYTAQRESEVVVYDLAAKTGQVVLRTPCATYYDTAGSGSDICGIVTRVIWIDPTTMFVFHFAGQMPDKMTCPDWAAPLRCPGELDANTYSIVTATGQIVATMPADSCGGCRRASGNTIVGDDTWLDLNEVRAGAATVKQLPAGALYYSLSPDGTRVAVPGDPWQLVDIRTGAVQALGTRAEIHDAAGNWMRDPCAWSPDGQFLAVGPYGADQLAVGPYGGYNIILVVPVSTASSMIAGTIPADAELIGWAP